MSLLATDIIRSVAQHTQTWDLTAETGATLVAMSQVCTKWRLDLISSPTLWSNILIQDTTTPAVVSTFIHNAAKQPLLLLVQVTGNTVWSSSLLRRVLAACDKWKWISFSPCTRNMHYYLWPGYSTKVHVPLLVSLALGSGSPFIPPRGNQGFTSFHLPNLEELRLSTLQEFEYTALLTTIVAPKLRDVAIDRLIWGVLDGIGDAQDKRSFPSVRSLELRRCVLTSRGDMETLWEIFPYITSLGVHASSNKAEKAVTAKGLMAAIAPNEEEMLWENLEHLWIRIGGWSPNETAMAALHGRAVKNGMLQRVTLKTGKPVPTRLTKRLGEAGVTVITDRT
ncbi:hypothetical protein CYLTODRAFT_439931 [Cylindrobasidium torrendii FP15055 ss-10]|uniref:F-box domain-containing protein n=1 Tax=Cylindrobasidium torrendii FP15055 ss-10 TaxID=1314674 RepID=A0A0D7BUT1_9AGAR|nr:hypothetical protein CYLTODRAFT_439931 [Cylindrobasidium torrendii FP15055 ss-10]